MLFNTQTLPLIGYALMVVTLVACDDDGPEPYDRDFNIPRTEAFAESLSTYGLFEGPIDALKPVAGIELYELSSELFTDYAYKQRLVKVPQGGVVMRAVDGKLFYPEGTILVKTFYYPEDMRTADGPRRIIETRLLVLREGMWNVATYLWNEAQTEATLLLKGSTTQVSWIDETGLTRSTTYAVPHEGECVTCHQSNGVTTYIGPSERNLNRSVTRGGEELNQLEHFTSVGIFSTEDWAATPKVPNYKDTSVALEERGRAYLHANCGHCHQPGAWDESADEDLDLRYGTALGATGLTKETNAVRRLFQSGEMPYLGTTMLHDEGVELVLSFLQTL